MLDWKDLSSATYPIVEKLKSPRSHVMLKNGKVVFMYPNMFETLEKLTSVSTTLRFAG